MRELLRDCIRPPLTVTRIALGWISGSAHGRTEIQRWLIAEQFYQSAEFRGNYGSLTDTQFVEQLYNNVLGRPGETRRHRFLARETGQWRIKGRRPAGICGIP